MKIRDAATLFNRRVIMAPMAGITIPSFFEILVRCGGDFVYTGLLTADGLVRGNQKTNTLIFPMPDSLDAVAQIFGSAPDVMADAAEKLASLDRFAAIDINMGCPAPKITKNAGGATLMRDPAKAGRIVAAVAGRVNLPVTVKIRSGWDADNLNFIEVARACVDNGAAAIALHPRTRSQNFTGRADWSHIKILKDNLNVPVIGSGDIDAPEDASRMFGETGCDSVMIGQAACRDPWILARAKQFISTGVTPPPPSPAERIDMLIAHLEIHVRLAGERSAVHEMRKFIHWQIRALPGATTVRRLVNTTETEAGVKEILEKYRHEISND